MEAPITRLGNVIYWTANIAAVGWVLVCVIAVYTSPYAIPVKWSTTNLLAVFLAVVGPSLVLLATGRAFRYILSGTLRERR